MSSSLCQCRRRQYRHVWQNMNHVTSHSFCCFSWRSDMAAKKEELKNEAQKQTNNKRKQKQTTPKQTTTTTTKTQPTNQPTNQPTKPTNNNKKVLFLYKYWQSNQNEASIYNFVHIFYVFSPTRVFASVFLEME